MHWWLLRLFAALAADGRLTPDDLLLRALDEIGDPPE